MLACGPRHPDPVLIDEKMPRKVHVFVTQPAELAEGDLEKLSRPGQLHAIELPRRLPLVEIDAVIAEVPDPAATLTLEPVLAVTGLEIEPRGPSTDALVDQIREHHQQTVLVVVAREDLRALVSALGVPQDRVAELGETAPDLLEIRIDGNATKMRVVP